MRVRQLAAVSEMFKSWKMQNIEKSDIDFSARYFVVGDDPAGEMIQFIRTDGQVLETARNFLDVIRVEFFFSSYILLCTKI